MRISVIALFLVGCGAAADAPRANLCRAPQLAAPLTPRGRVVLVTLDGVRWQDVLGDGARARLPNLYALADRGLMLGDRRPFSASGPNYVSLPGYREILSGHPTDCRDNDCDPVTEPTLLDELRQAGLGPEQIAAIGSWDRLDRAAAADASSIVCSFGRTHGKSRDRVRVSNEAGALLDQGARARTWPGDGDYRPDALTAALALEYARVVRPRFLWVALGDTDEHAHHGDYAAYLAALSRADAFLGELVRTTDDETLILVTTDHGRAANFRDHGRSPESGAAWLVAAGPGIHAASPRRLADLAGLARHALGLAPDRLAVR
jgi:predicted AlkP superfamily pyrophosphatase or phosphodiesterase